MPCPPNHNPGDFYINVLASIPGEEEESKKRIKEICDAFETSDVGKDMMQMVKDNQPAVASANGGDTSIAGQPNAILKRSPYKASWSTQFSAVLWRSWTTVLREPRVLRMKGVQTIVRQVMMHEALYVTLMTIPFLVCCSITCPHI